MIRVEHPVITDEELARLENIALPELPLAHAARACSRRPRAARACARALDRLCAEAERAVRERREHPDPVATAASRPTSRRSRCCSRPAPCTTTWSARRCARAAASSARPARRARSSHIALLIGYGAGAVNPYLALQTVEELVARGHLHARGSRSRDGASTTTSRRATRACSRRSRRWGSRRCSRTAARRSSRRSGSTASWSSAASRARRRASRASATT